MKKFLSLFAAILFLGGTQMWGENLTKTEGFETKAPGTNYQSTVTVSGEESDCGIGWSIYYGTVSTNDKISGSQSAQMRYYSNKDDRGYVQSTTAVEGLSNVAFKARVSSLDMKLTVSYSADGSAWTALATNVAFSATGAAGVQDLNYDIPSGGQYIKFEVAEGSTKPSSSGNIKLIIDDVVFTYAEQGGETPAANYYVVGSMNSWTVSEDYILIPNNEAEGQEFMGEFTFAANDEFKVVLNDKVAWFPDGMDNNFVISEAGDYTVYFRPNGDGGEGWHYGCIYAAKKETPTPQPAAAVVLPATLDVSNVSFRSEGMPDFVIEEGQDYAGTYFDMGAHDSANDTLLYAEWDVTIEPIKYNIAVDVYNTNSWRVQLYLLSQAGDTLKSLRYKGSSEQKGQFSIGSLDLSDLEAGNYKVRAHAATAWSAMKLKDVIFTADYQGVNVDLPGTLLPAYAELSANASIQNGAIAFKPSTANDEYAIWNVTFAEAGDYNVTIDITASNGHNYGVALLDGETEIGAMNEGGQHGDTGVKELGAITVPAAGSYKVKLTNATQWSEAVLNSITFAAPAAPALENGFYLVGNFNTWTPAAEYHLVGNPDNNAEFMVNVTLAENDELKVVNVLDGNITAWFPGGDNYVVDANHAGEKTVYFRPDYQGGEDWFGACIYIAPNAEPQPVEMTAIYDWAGEIGTTIFGGNSNITTGTVKIHENTDDVSGIKFGSSYVYADGKYIAIKPAEGGFKAGDVLSVSVVFNNSDITKYCMADVYAADGATRMFRSDSASTLNGRNAGEPIVQTYTLAADQDSLLIGRYGNTGMFITLLKVERAGGVEPQPQGCDWDAIDFLGDGSAEQTHSNQFKVCKVGEQPNVVNIQTPGFAAETGIYVTFPSAVFGEISLSEGQYVIEGAGMVLYLSAFTQEYTEVTVNCEGNDIVFTVYNAAAAPQPVEHTYTVAGNSAAVFGAEWNPENTAADMTLVEGIYTFVKEEVELVAGNIEFKVCEDHAWTTAYPAQNYQLAIPVTGIYTISITFNPDSKEVAAVANKTGDAEIDPTVSVKGGWDSWAAEVAFTLADNKETATCVLTLEAGNYEFKVILNGSDWRSNGYTYHRDFTGAEDITGNGDNMVLQADAAGEYTITWTFANNAIAIVFPTATAISNTAADVEAVKVLHNGMLLIRKGDKTYTIMGQAVK